MADLGGRRAEDEEGAGPGVGSYGVTRETYDKVRLLLLLLVGSQGRQLWRDQGDV